MPSAVERFLYGDLGVQGVCEFMLSPGVVRLRLAPWEGPRVATVATFHDARIKSVETYADSPDELELPWDIIGFDCFDLGSGRWEFVLHCDAIDWCFESAWPIAERVDT
jgi:hypothetical protein